MRIKIHLFLLLIFTISCSIIQNEKYAQHKNIKLSEYTRYTGINDCYPNPIIYKIYENVDPLSHKNNDINEIIKCLKDYTKFKSLQFLQEKLLKGDKELSKPDFSLNDFNYHKLITKKKSLEKYQSHIYFLNYFLLLDKSIKSTKDPNILRFLYNFCMDIYYYCNGDIDKIYNILNSTELFKGDKKVKKEYLDVVFSPNADQIRQTELCWAKNLFYPHYNDIIIDYDADYLIRQLNELNKLIFKINNYSENTKIKNLQLDFIFEFDNTHSYNKNKLFSRVIENKKDRFSSELSSSLKSCSILHLEKNIFSSEEIFEELKKLKSLNNQRIVIILRQNRKGLILDFYCNKTPNNYLSLPQSYPFFFQLASLNIIHEFILSESYKHWLGFSYSIKNHKIKNPLMFSKYFVTTLSRQKINNYINKYVINNIPRLKKNLKELLTIEADNKSKKNWIELIKRKRIFHDVIFDKFKNEIETSEKFNSNELISNKDFLEMVKQIDLRKLFNLRYENKTYKLPKYVSFCFDNSMYKFYKSVINQKLYTHMKFDNSIKNLNLMLISGYYKENSDKNKNLPSLILMLLSDFIEIY